MTSHSTCQTHETLLCLEQGRGFVDALAKEGVDVRHQRACPIDVTISARNIGAYFEQDACLAVSREQFDRLFSSGSPDQILDQYVATIKADPMLAGGCAKAI